MKALITGGAGFIGSRIAEALLRHGYEVAVIDNLSTGLVDNVPSDASLVRGDIREKTDIPVGQWDVIYHCAASYKDRYDWESDASTNVLGTINVVREAERSGAKLIYFQTSLCYGPKPESPIKTTAVLNPVGSYAVSKTAGEAFIRDSGVPYVSLRLANIYGPRNLSGPIPTFYKRLMEGQTCTIVDSRRDFVFVDDLVWVAVNAATQGEGVYHIASGHDYAISSVYDAVTNAMGLDPPPPQLVPRGADDVATLLLDPTETQVTFRWKAVTPLALGVAKAVVWYREHGVRNTYTHLRLKG